MKMFLTTVGLGIATFGATVLFTAPPVFGQVHKLSDRLRHEEAIRQVLARFERAFEERDAKICAGEFVDDAEWENDYGSREKGRANIQRRLADIYSVVRYPKQQIIEWRIRFITDDVAVADLDREILEQLDPEESVRYAARKIRTTHILKRDDGKWQVVILRVAELRAPREIP